MAVITNDDLDVSQPEPEPAPFPSGRSAPTVTGALTLAAVCSLTAAAIHFSFAGAHFDERATHGAFFLAAAALQAAWAIAALKLPTRAAARLSLFHLAIAGVWLASRTIGVDGMDAEPVGYPDALATGLALGAAGLSLAGLRLRRNGAFPGRRIAGTALATAVAAAGLVAMTPRFATAHGHGSDEAAAAHGHTEAGQRPGATDAGHAGAAALTGDTPCEKSGPPASPAQNTVTDAEGHSHRGPVPQKPIDQATRAQLAAQQVIARQAAERYPTVADATKRGYRMSTAYIPRIGAHYTNVGLAARFDPAQPAELLFDGTKPDSKLVGLSYLVYHPGGAPEGFAGPNDVWHQHNANGGLCFNTQGVVIAGEESSPEQCGALGGRKVELTDVWMLHDWIVPGWECSWGVFAPECPELGGRTGASAWE